MVKYMLDCSTQRLHARHRNSAFRYVCNNLTADQDDQKIFRLFIEFVHDINMDVVTEDEVAGMTPLTTVCLTVLPLPRDGLRYALHEILRTVVRQFWKSNTQVFFWRSPSHGVQPLGLACFTPEFTPGRAGPPSPPPAPKTCKAP
jgi:hypothetical protein